MTADSGLREVRQPAAPTRVLLWCAGVDAALVRSQRLRLLYAAYGLMLVLVAALAATSFTVFGSVIIGHFTVGLIPFAVLWALFIFGADRLIVMEPKQPHRRARSGPGTPAAARPADRAEPAGPTATGPTATGPAPTADGTAPPTSANGSGPTTAHDGIAPARPAAVADEEAERPHHAVTVVKYLVRFALAVFAAVLVGEAVLLLIFSPEVDRELTTGHDHAITAEREKPRQDMITPIQQAVTELDGQISTDQVAFNELEGKGRGRDRPCGRPPAQIPASGVTALGSCLG